MPTRRHVLAKPSALTAGRQNDAAIAAGPRTRSGSGRTIETVQSRPAAAAMADNA
jgi:hypothetical protein